MSGIAPTALSEEATRFLEDLDRLVERGLLAWEVGGGGELRLALTSPAGGQALLERLLRSARAGEDDLYP